MTRLSDDEPTLRGVVAVGGSAGGVEALARMAAGLAADFPYAVMVALHHPVDAPSALARIVDRAGPLPAAVAGNGEPLLPGRIYVAVPNHHLVAADHRTLLSTEPAENGHRPSLNVMFRSVAADFGTRGVGVLLSGVLNDGVHGLAAIRSRGGRTIAQSPVDALFAELPLKAIAAGVVNRDAPASEIGALLAELDRADGADYSSPASGNLTSKRAPASRL
jgi:two-component system, chemotaxis family, protein-glutamate methylesterase/glutaminase